MTSAFAIAPLAKAKRALAAAICNARHMLDMAAILLCPRGSNDGTPLSAVINFA
jgi:hypothetical protein